MLAVALPPTRGCRITIEEQKMIGNNANMPDANEPMLELAVVTTATTMAAASARSGISKAVRRNSFGGPRGAIAPAQRNGDREDHGIERHGAERRPVDQPQQRPRPRTTPRAPRRD